MHVGILGPGDVGRALGKGFAGAGHDVMLGTRDPQQAKVRAWLAEVGPRASAGSFAEAAEFGEAVVLAIPWSGVMSVLDLVGPERLAGKLVIDPTNPLDFSAMPPALAVGHTDSGGEQIQRRLPRSNVVKAFNIVGSPHMVKPQFPGGPPDMFICGNDVAAKAATSAVLHQFGWSVIDLGGIEASRYLEPLAMVWILHYFQIRSPNHAFKMLRT